MICFESFRSGGAIGADLEWTIRASEAGIAGTILSFEGHAETWKKEARRLFPNVEIRDLSQQDLDSKWENINEANRRLDRNLSNLDQHCLNLLLRNAWIIEGVTATVAIADQVNTKTMIVGGGTGWTVEMSILAGIPTFVISQRTGVIYQFGATSPAPALIQYPRLCGDVALVGTRKLTNEGQRDIRNVIAYNQHRSI